MVFCLKCSSESDGGQDCKKGDYEGKRCTSFDLAYCNEEESLEIKVGGGGVSSGESEAVS